MFEAQIAYYLNEYLGTYVQGIDRDSLKVSIYAGDVVLRNLRLKQDALQDLDLPVSVEAGMLGSLTLKVPWNNLGGTPVVAEVNQLYLLVRPRSGEKSHGVSQDDRDAFDEFYQKSRISRVERKEKAWVKGLERMKMHEGGQQQQKGFLKGLIDTVVGNLQVSIKNIHVRYEDGVTRPGQVFSCGFTLKRLSAFTVDAQGNKAFIASKVMDALRKSLELERMSLYFDCDTIMWSPIETWDGVDTDTWREWFQPDIEKDDLGRRYVLRPVDGRASYVRRWKDLDQEKDAATELSIQLDTVSVSVSRDQYCNYSLLLTEISQYTARLPYSGFRPQCRPEAGEKARCWWMYLLYVHKQNAETRKFKWDQVIQSVKLRSKYISLYKVMLKMADLKARKDVLIPDEVQALYERDRELIVDMEKELSEATLFMFRRVARTEYAEEQQEVAAKNARKQQRGWMGWLMGAPAPDDSAGSSTDDAKLSSTEYETMLEVLQEQEESMSLKFETPYTMLSKYIIHVDSVSLILAGESTNDTVLEGSMQNIVTEVVLYPQTMSIRVNIVGMGVDSPKGSFVKTGRSVESEEGYQSEALAVYFISKPQDGRADAVLNVELAPSFVFYDPGVVRNVVDFFQPPEEFAVQDLGELSLAAASQIERAKQIAADYAVAAWSGKPKLEMSLVLNAPKISIPSKDLEKHLALDLGSFIIQSDNDMMKSLPNNERALYECIKIKGSNLSAFMAGDVIEWGRQGNGSSSSWLLDQCAVDLSLHIARYSDKDYPMIRILSSIPKLQFAIGPTLVAQLMQVLGNIAPEKENVQPKDPSTLDRSWLESAEWKRSCRVLFWTSFQSNALWKEYEVMLYHSTLYRIEGGLHGSIARQYSLTDKSIVSKVPENVLGLKYVVAIHQFPENDWKAILREADSWVVQFNDEEDLDTFIEEINSNLHRIRAIASDIHDEDSNDNLSQGQSNSVVYLRAELAELKIILSGRGPLYYGKYDQVQEVDLISLTASTGTLDFHYGPDAMEARISLMALRIDDMICGPLQEEKYLATSCMDCASTESKNLADFTLQILSPTNPSYQGVQTSLCAKLDSLYFFCNRPTIGCLMAFGSDISAAISQGSSGAVPVEENPQDVEEIVAASVLLFCHDPDTTSFLLDVELQKLQLVLNYEDSSGKLAEADITDFSFTFKTISDSSMKLTSSLGNLNLSDLTLEPNNINAHICGLRDSSQSSLISIHFDMYPAHVRSGLSCPDGLCVYSLVANLSKLKILFLNRFVQQCIQYISYMLQFRPDELAFERKETTFTLSEKQKPASSDQPFVLVMKLSMDAPLIIMPRCSTNERGVQADLGTLTLENQIKRANTGELLENSVLHLSGVTLVPSFAGEEASSLINLSEEGWVIQWQRPLEKVEDKGIPEFGLSIAIPTLEASLSDKEYESITTIASSNISEEIVLPSDIDSLHKQMSEIAPLSSLTSDMAEHVLISPRISSYVDEKPEGINFRLHISMNHLELNLYNEIEQRNRNALGQLQINNLDVSYTAFASSDTLIEVSLPKLEISDRRSHVCVEQSLVISSGHRASFLMMRYYASEQERDIDIILQKPMIILELGFLLELTRFFVPSFSFVKSDPLPFVTYDIVLEEGLTHLSNDLWLCPTTRILADAQSADYIIDGNGYSVFLPPVEDLADVLPLIMVGPNSSLELRNLKVINSHSLDACLKLGPGARILLSKENGIDLINISEEVGLFSGDDPEKNNIGNGDMQKTKLTVHACNVGVYLLETGSPMTKMQSGYDSNSTVAHTIKTQADLNLQMQFDEQNLYIESSVLGLRASHNRIANLTKQAISRTSQELASHKKLKAKKESDILLPTRIEFDFNSSESDMNMNLSVSEVQSYISPGLLEIGTKLLREALAPLQQPGPDEAAFAVSKFQKLCTVKCSGREPVYNQTLLLETDMITFWRPSIPTGYAFGGHVITSGEKAPSFEVMSLAINSGLVKCPDRFELLFTNDFVWLWEPIAPEGFAAVGIFATTSPRPPSSEHACCVACAALVPAPMGERFRFSADQNALVISNVDNSFGTFLQEQSPSICPADLRFPLGVTTYGLSSRGLISSTKGNHLSAVQGLGKKMQDEYLVSERQLKSSRSGSVISPQTMDFKRVWTDNGALSASRGVSIWRPVPPPGYLILGDAFQNGFEPPKFAHVLKFDSSRVGSNGAKHCVRPLKFQMIWRDGNPKHEHGLSIWKPISPEGYTAVGCVAQIGMTQPDVDVACVLNELLHTAAPPRKPLWSIRAADQTVNPLSVWLADERTRCFYVDPSDSLIPPEISVLNTDALKESLSTDSGKTIDAVIRVKSVTTTLLDTIGSPMLMLNVDSIESGIRGYSQEVMQSYGGFKPSLQTYNTALGQWEPVVEPFDAIIKVDSNFSNQNASGIEPGVHLSMKSSTEMILSTLAVKQMRSVVAVFEETNAALQHELRSEEIAFSFLSNGNGLMKSQLRNELGVAINLEVEEYDSIQSYCIPENSKIQIERPVPQNLLGLEVKGDQTAVPPSMLLIDIQTLKWPAISTRGHITAYLRGNENKSSFHPRTRSILVTNGEVSFDERLVLSLAQQNEAITDCEFEVWDIYSDCGRGSVAARGQLKLRDIEPQNAQHTIHLSKDDKVIGSVNCQVQIQTHGISKKRATDSSKALTNTGQRAINISSSENIWRIIPEVSQSLEQNHSESKSNNSVAFIQFDNDLVIIETVANKGFWTETIRSNCSFRNQTGLPVSLELKFQKSHDRKSLGVVQQGKSVSLPMYWNSPDVFLSIVPESEGLCTCLVDQNDQGVSLSEIQDGWSSCVECRPSNRAGTPIYFSVYASSQSLPRVSMKDWEVVLVPPLILRNHVPVPLQVQLEQGIEAANTLYSGLVETGSNVPIYGANILEQILLKFESEEYIWLEKGPIPVAGKCPLRESARLSRSGQEIPTEIFISKSSGLGNRGIANAASIVLTLFSPLWILNKTSWGLKVAIISTLNLTKKQHTDSNLAQKFGGTTTFGSYVSSSDEMDVDHVSNGRSISPGSVELLSFPSTSAQDSSGTPYAIRIKVQGSGWTEPILFDDEFAKKHGYVAVSSRPTLLFADSRAHSTAYGAVIRLEMSDFKESRMLHIDAHMLIQNRSQVDFEGFQCRLKDYSRLDPKQKSENIFPEGGSLQHSNYAFSSTSSNPIVGKSFVKMSDESFDEMMHTKALFDLPADCMSRPVNFVRGLHFHAVCLRQASGSTTRDFGIWSRPIIFDDIGEGTKFVLVPKLRDNMVEGHAMIRLRSRIRGPGLMMITIESADCYPPYVLENRTQYPLQYVQPGCDRAPVYDLPSHAATGFVPDFSTPGEKVRVELFSEGFKSYSKTVDLDDERDAEAEELSISSAKSCLIKASFESAIVLTPTCGKAMSGDSTGYSIGRGGIEKVVQIASEDIEVIRLPQISSDVLNEIFFTLDIPGLSVSIIDAHPREVALITISGIKAEFDRFIMPNGIGVQVALIANSLQIDNQMPGTLLPVALSRALASKGPLPMIEVRYNSFSSRTRAGVLLPFIGCRTPNRIQLAIEESLIWRLYGVYESLMSLTPSSAESQQITAAVDAFVRLRLLSVSRTDLTVSFQNNPLSRPLSIQDSSVGMILDLAAFKGAKIALKGFELEHLNLSQSSLTQKIIERVRSDLFAAAFSLISTFGVVGGASRIIGFIGAKVAKFADTGPARKQQSQVTSETSQSTQPTESTDSLKTSVIRGFKGLVSKPVEGAKKDGFEGAFKGVAKGVVGVFANPMSTMLASSSDGYNSNFAKDRAQFLVLERKRLPRVISASGRITPMTRRGTDRESVLEALGQSFLWATWIADPVVENIPLESYEEHFVLPDGYVLLFTNSSILHVHSPYFAELDGAAEIGTLPAIEIPPGNINWRIMWEDLLAMELRWSDPKLQPDRLIIHRKGNNVHSRSIAGRKPILELSREVTCFPKTPQASQIKFIAGRLLSKYYQDPQRQDHRWAMRHEARAALPQDKPVEDFPLQMPCTSFENSWHTNPRRSPIVHFWTPVPPPGYKPVGSVATLGPEQPLAPVPCFRDDITLRGPQKLDADRPPVAFPEEYSLIWRFNGERQVTMWMPVPPKGYVAMGAIILDSASTPSLDDFVCLRDDLVEETRIFDSPIWSYDPDAILAEAASQPSAKASLGKSFKSLNIGSSSQTEAKPISDQWKVSVWQVDNGTCMTLLVVRGLKKPPTKLSFTLTGADGKT